MAVAPISLLESLRCWHAAGLRMILLDGSVNSFLARPAAVERPPVVPAPHAAPAFSTGAPAASPASQTPPLHSAEPSHAEARAKPPLSRGAAQAVDASPVCTPAAVRASCSHEFMPCDEWPAPWQAAFAKTKKATVLWSYHELGLDMAGGGSAARSGFFRSLIGFLNLPGGSSVFWPCTAFSSKSSGQQEKSDSDSPHKVLCAELTANPRVFFSGVQLLEPRVLVLWGEEAFRDCGLEPGASFSQCLCYGRLLVQVPAVDEVLADAALSRKVRSFLLSILPPLA